MLTTPASHTPTAPLKLSWRSQTPSNAVLSPSPLTSSSTTTPSPPSTYIALIQALERAERAESEVSRLSAALDTTKSEVEELKSTIDTRVSHGCDELREKVEKEMKEESMLRINEKVRMAMAKLTEQQAAAERTYDKKLKHNQEHFTRRLAQLEADSGDKVRAKLAHVQAAYNALVAQTSKSTERIAQKRREIDLHNVHSENEALLRANAQQAAQLARLEQAHGLPPRNGSHLREISTQTAGPEPTYRAIIPMRQGDSPESPLTPRTLAYLRQIVEDGDLSFRGASTVISLVLAMLFEDGADEASMVSHKTVRDAFELLGAADDECARAADRRSTSYWSAAGDGATERRAMHLMAVARFEPHMQKPEASALAASELFQNHSAANGKATMLAAIDAAALRGEFCACICTDHTEHAIVETEGTQQALWERMPTESRDIRRSDTTYCCIHAKNLEETAGMEAMWHGERFVGAYRILWELVGEGADGSRPIEYKLIWTEHCRFSEDLWHSTLGSMPEPTSSKWQVMHEIVEKLEPLFEPVEDEHSLTPTHRRTYLEKFLDVNARLALGDSDDSRTVCRHFVFP